jgi:glutamate racemase
MTRSIAPTIGVFDSGFGGLTVLRALLPLIPGAHYIYLGDTARLPYGAKSRETVARYAVSSARYLEDQGADLLVIACNTATALALDDIRQACRVPVVGVIAPGAQAAHNAIAKVHPTSDVSSRPEAASFAAGVESPASPEGAGGFSALKTAQPKGASAPGLPPAAPQILVLATAATIQSHAYREACATLNLRVIEKACPLLVPLVEEGWVDHPVTREVLRIYLTEALAECSPAAVLLGCTHYPLIADAIRSTLLSLGHNIAVIDSAAATAYTVAHSLGYTSDSRDRTTPIAATFQCFATDSVEKFQRLGSVFLSRPIPQVTLLDLGG